MGKRKERVRRLENNVQIVHSFFLFEKTQKKREGSYETPKGPQIKGMLNIEGAEDGRRTDRGFGVFFLVEQDTSEITRAEFQGKKEKAEKM